MNIEFIKDDELDAEFRPTSFWTTFDEGQKKRVKYRDTIRAYYQECVNTDLRGYDIDEGDRFSLIPQAIKYLDHREYAIPMFHYMLREVQVKEFNSFWQFVMFFASYISTPKLIALLREYSSVLFHLHDETLSGGADENSMGGAGGLVDFLTTICEGALYPIATSLFVSAYLEEEGENYWREDTTEELSDHFRKMAETIMDDIESDHLVAIVLEVPTNIYLDDDEDIEDQKGGMSVIDIAIHFRMLKFLQNYRISSLATSLWYNRKVVHPSKRFGQELSAGEIFTRLRHKPAKFYFSPSGLRIVKIALYVFHMGLFLYVTYSLKYNFETAYSMPEMIL